MRRGTVEAHLCILGTDAVRIQDFAPIRTFTSAKLINNRLLNRLGLQVGRTVAARLLFNMRSGPRHAEIASELTTLRRDGILRIENFLDPATFAAVTAECRQVFCEESDRRIVRRHHGPTTYETARVADFDQGQRQ